MKPNNQRGSDKIQKKEIKESMNSASSISSDPDPGDEAEDLLSKSQKPQEKQFPDLPSSILQDESSYQPSKQFNNMMEDFNDLKVTDNIKFLIKRTLLKTPRIS